MDTNIIKTDLKERVKKTIQGHFKIQVIEDGVVIDSYEDYNKIVVWVYNLFGRSVYGYQPPDIDEYRIQAFAIGTDGATADGIIKDIANDQKKMYSEINFWDNPNYTGEERNAYVYQATFTKPGTNDPHFAYKINEGATYPAWGLGSPKDYRGEAYNEEDSLEGCLSIRRSFQNSVLKQEIYLGKLAGNGHPMWEEAPEFSEAALYMPEGTASGDSLGTMFSMKTFPKMKKTDACVIKINWDLDFSL